MAVSVTGNISLLAQIIDARTSVSGAANELGSRNITVSGAWAIAAGTGVGQADKVWSDTRIVTTGATDVIDMAGVLTDSFGATVTFVKVRAILAVAALGNTTTLKVQRPAATGTVLFDAAGAIVSGLAAVSFGGIMIAWSDPQAGIAIGSGTTDLITVVNSAGASATYTIAILGTSV